MQNTYQLTRDYLKTWQEALKANPYETDLDFKHSVAMYFSRADLQQELSDFAAKVVNELEPLVAENNYRFNWPRLEKYDGMGEAIEKVVHHPSYIAAGNIIYGSKMLARLAKAGGMLESLVFFFLSGQVGEAGHNCPFACSAGIIRVLQKVDAVPQTKHYIEKLCEPSFTHNFTGAQFLTEIQGGSDVGQNAVEAFQNEHGQWHIQGEKWFCSNANADLILLTARYGDKKGTSGLALFLVPRIINDQINGFSLRRLKEKIGTCSMASGEIDFDGALAFPVGKLEEGFKLVMENVLHVSRLCNTFCMLGMARRALHIAKAYAKVRIAFGQPIIQYPLVQENLARIKAENDAMLASIFSTVALQDQADTHPATEETKLLLRLLANLNKYISALWSVEHIHHAIDVLAGNGTIETFSPLPRLLRDSIVCENWEGTHNTLRMQILRDIHKLNIHELLFRYIESELKQIHEPRKTLIASYLSTVKQACTRLMQADPALQSLMIRDVVDKLAKVYLAASLLKEALHQHADQACSNKLYSFDYFCLLHLGEHTPALDQNYLKLVQNILL